MLVIFDILWPFEINLYFLSVCVPLVVYLQIIIYEF